LQTTTNNDSMTDDLYNSIRSNIVLCISASSDHKKISAQDTSILDKLHTLC